MDKPWTAETYHDVLFENVRVNERRGNLKWRLFLQLDELAAKHEVEIEDCHTIEGFVKGNKLV